MRRTLVAVVKQKGGGMIDVFTIYNNKDNRYPFVEVGRGEREGLGWISITVFVFFSKSSSELGWT